jgi:hypothetical protein
VHGAGRPGARRGKSAAGGSCNANEQAASVQQSPQPGQRRPVRQFGGAKQPGCLTVGAPSFGAATLLGDAEACRARHSRELCAWRGIQVHCAGSAAWLHGGARVEPGQSIYGHGTAACDRTAEPALPLHDLRHPRHRPRLQVWPGRLLRSRSRLAYRRSGDFCCSLRFDDPHVDLGASAPRQNREEPFVFLVQWRPSGSSRSAAQRSDLPSWIVTMRQGCDLPSLLSGHNVCLLCGGTASGAYMRTLQ